MKPARLAPLLLLAACAVDPTVGTVYDAPLPPAAHEWDHGPPWPEDAAPWAPPPANLAEIPPAYGWGGAGAYPYSYPYPYAYPGVAAPSVTIGLGYGWWWGYRPWPRYYGWGAPAWRSWGGYGYRPGWGYRAAPPAYRGWGGHGWGGRGWGGGYHGGGGFRRR
ncbi:hypothetical protein [Sabulicella rubraurantiaca]|uniref:hypothetical protein n=1 Tax=Sabulicella rubraurantiaca TaxID=2811429 RepID=UPI001A9796F6|nr:hypothetical protein [Sabulicella rubraurantiaca]